ncbi:hypothetical protein BRADI_1g13121v3 [Brachypodium distachyon]|uniref:Uncharacterized protein n=1 Tax=Brachypodium distachyon TaxID=15368 RepID=A0A0Q3JPL9_BRADI|nr:hypothetical protein BRADI_1g13121v3 [Brachypodium distachyon]
MTNSAAPIGDPSSVKASMGPPSKDKWYWRPSMLLMKIKPSSSTSSLPPPAPTATCPCCKTEARLPTASVSAARERVSAEPA